MNEGTSLHISETDLQEKTILIIDDNPSNLKVLAEYLEAYGFEISVARNGESGLEKARFIHPALILMDVIMPGLDGFKTCRRLKASEDTKDIPVIFMTALLETEGKIKGFQAGAVDYITKPFRKEEVLARVNTHLRLRELTEQLERKVQERTHELTLTTKRLEQEIAKHEHAEEEIRSLNAELDQRVSARTAELDAANKELRDFAYVVSHDLKAPLRGISKLAHWLVGDYQDVIDDNGREMAELLIGRVKRMDALIEGILHYSRIGRIYEKDVAIDLNVLLHEVLDLLNPPGHIQISINSDFPVIVAERTRMFQIFQNLIDNAVKFLDKPNGEINICCMDNETHWTFSIVDNGPGIESRHQEKIFQIFQTLQPCDDDESTGIGLALVKKIVELYGGNIGVESVIGRGATFWFTFPKNQTIAGENSKSQKGETALSSRKNTN